MTDSSREVEMSGPSLEKKKPRLFTLVWSQTYVTPDAIAYTYPGSGTLADPFLVEFLPDDPRNPYSLPTSTKWLVTMIMALSTLSVSLSSSAFSGALPQIQNDFGASAELAVASVSVFVLGFAIGPMTWAPMSELYGRQIVFALTYILATVFSSAAVASPNIAAFLVLRFFSGMFGSSGIANAAGVVSDIFVARERGLAVMVYTSAPFLGPVLGPICGAFLSESAGWKWVAGMTAIFTGVMAVVGILFVPETYSPYLLIRRAEKLSRLSGKVYKSKLEAGKTKTTAVRVFNEAIGRPWAILFFEPIVLALSIYSSISRFSFSSFTPRSWTFHPPGLFFFPADKVVLLVYGILYLIFTAFPIVFAGERHWSQGMAGLSNLGVMVGQIIAMFFYVFLETSYRKKIARDPSLQSPEARLDPAMIGGVVLPVGLFWFAWTTYPSVHWAVSIVGSSLFGFGEVLLFISLINYVIDTYTIFAASALAASAILRALFGAALYVSQCTLITREAEMPTLTSATLLARSLHSTCMRTSACSGLRRSLPSWPSHVHRCRSSSIDGERRSAREASCLSKQGLSWTICSSNNSTPVTKPPSAM
jgi:MFS family permease